MPVDATAQAHDYRKPAGRKFLEDSEGGHVRDIELKRSRGEVSCAECRRLKIKCDKKLPCSSCLRRGCATLCPNGSLSTGQGTRSVLAATDHLHRRIAKMSERIRQLEDALAVLQSQCSSERHPLLRDELLATSIRKVDDGALDPEADVPGGSEFVDAFGTLTLTDKGNSRFFGAAGGTERLLMGDEYSPGQSSELASETSSAREARSPSLPPDVVRFSQSFPFTPMGPTRAVQELIESHLPTWERAQELSEIYLENAAWLFHAVSPQQLKNEMLPIIYKRRVAADPAHDYSGPHDLAVLFMVFSVGALVDLSQEPNNTEAEHYYHLGQAAITLQSVLERPELVTIQALHLMSIYNAMCQTDQAGHENNMEMSWSLIRLCIQLAETIGLHRDSARWGLTPRDVQRRRALFWDLYIADSWQCLSTGRPPSITLPYVDCQFPLDDEEKLNTKGEVEPSFGHWGFRFACDVVAHVAGKTLTAQVPAYWTILDLDRTVREYTIPELPADLPIDPKKPSLFMMRFVLSHTREVILQFVHRSFFAQAMIDDPVNPLRSQYAPSYLATYRVSAHILKTIKDLFPLMPELVARFWSPWTYAFSAAIVFGTIVTRGPTSNMALSALKELDEGCTLFSKASQHSRRAAKALIILQRLKTKAQHAFANAHNSTLPRSLHGNDEEKEDELAIFGGRTRLVSAQRPSPSPSASPEVFSPEQSPPPTNEPDVRTQEYAVSGWARDQEPYPVDPRAAPRVFVEPIYDAIPKGEYAWEWRQQQQPTAPSYLPPPPQQHHQQGYLGEQYVGARYEMYHAPPPATASYHGHDGQVYFTPVARELAEMGLAQDSVLNQRWTTFMQESGVFYGNA